jgi:hypothetical protein
MEAAQQSQDETMCRLEETEQRLAQMPGVATRMQKIVRRATGGAGGPGRVLVIRSADTDPKTQASLEEDLAVMSRIFDKALDEEVGGSKHGWTAMGIDLSFMPGSNPIRSLYLDGYGALFMLNVGFPLLPPPAKAEEPKETRPADSAWEEARREVYGQPADRKVVPDSGEEFDGDKVNTLKDALLEGLKSATNIRNLKSDDWITVCVFGGGSAAPVKVKTVKVSTKAGAPPAEFLADEMTYDVRANEVFMRNGVFLPSGSRNRGTILTIRVKKSDVDAFAKGRLNLDEFRKKASLTTYIGDVGSMTTGAVGFSGGGSGWSH